MTATSASGRHAASRQLAADPRANGPALEHAVKMIHHVCCIAGSANLVEEIRADEICGAIDRRDTGAIYNWLVSGLSFQGVSDEVAINYMDRHGRPTWRGIKAKRRRGPTCPKLTSY